MAKREYPLIEVLYGSLPSGAKYRNNKGDTHVNTKPRRNRQPPQKKVWIEDRPTTTFGKLAVWDTFRLPGEFHIYMKTDDDHARLGNNFGFEFDYTEEVIPWTLNI